MYWRFATRTDTWRSMSLCISHASRNTQAVLHTLHSVPLPSESSAAYGEYHEVKASMKKLSLAKRNVEIFLDITHAREEKTTEQSRGK